MVTHIFNQKEEGMIKIYQLRSLQNNYIVSVPFKGVRVRCEFKNGNIAKGIYARLYTNDRFKQMALEQSELYGNTWVLVEKIKEADDDVVKPAVKKPEKIADSVAPKQTKQEEKPVEAAPETQTAKGESVEAAEAAGEKTQGEKDGQLEFANLGEAVLYIAQNFNQQVQSASQARKVLSENGIKAIIHNG